MKRLVENGVADVLIPAIMGGDTQRVYDLFKKHNSVFQHFVESEEVVQLGKMEEPDNMRLVGQVEGMKFLCDLMMMWYKESKKKDDLGA